CRGERKEKMICKKREKVFKKELKKIDRILGKIEDTYEPRPKFNYGHFRDFVYHALDQCYKAKEIIENSSVKEMHDKPHPLLARHIGVYTRSSKDIKFYRGNIDMLKNIAMEKLFNHCLFLGTPGEIEEKVKVLFSWRDPLTKETLQEKLAKLDLNKDNLERYIEGKIIEYGQRTATVVDKMVKLSKEGQYEFGLIERFVDYFDKIKKLKGWFDPRDIYVHGLNGSSLGLDDLERMVENYSLMGLNLILKNLRSKQDMNNPKSIYYALFDNQGLKELEIIREFVKKKAENDKTGWYLAGNGLSLPLKEKLEKDYEIIEQEKEKFKKVIEKKQSAMEKSARNVAGKADKSYKIYLDKFMSITQEYSELLEEEEEDVKKALVITSPDDYIVKNEEAMRGLLANYAFAKLTRYGGELENLPLHKIYRALHDAQREHYRNHGYGISLNEACKNYQLPLHQECKELAEARLPKFVADVKKEYVKALRKREMR
ncbi:MAG: hypothetical protein K6T73_07705, partial [Candidatus Bathyarchaeota archaeon]|nr:hypothetical protein [Candidatus Bathyarchaeota archaeon]